MKNKERVGGVIFALLGLLVLSFTTQVRMPANLSEPGPRLFPYIAGAGMAICGLGMALTAKQESGEPFLTKEGWKRLGIAGLAMVIYYIGLEYLGFLIATPFFTFAIILILASGKKLNKVANGVISLATTGILYVVFQKIFIIFLPAGKFFG